LVEAAVRNHLLKLEGNDATQLLIERQEANMRQSDD
jgi:serine kinase of HPr protein (carbohydrate metabolism regulator)